MIRFNSIVSGLLCTGLLTITVFDDRFIWIRDLVLVGLGHQQLVSVCFPRKQMNPHVSVKAH